jgi:predicted permease
MVLLVVSGLFVRTLANLDRQQFGFDREHLLLVWALPGHTGQSRAEIVDLWDAIQQRLSALPGVAAVSASVDGMLRVAPSGGPTLVAVGGDPADSIVILRTNTIAPNYFATVGQPLLAGREFVATDTGGPREVVIVNQTVARRLFGGRNPVGREVMMRGYKSPIQIVGVVADARESPRAPVEPAVFYPVRQNLRRVTRALCIVVRTRGEPSRAASAVRQAMREAAPSLPILDIDTVDQQLDAVLFQERLVASLATAFATLALVLACMGVYGLIAYVTARRTTEIGIRMALGADWANVVGSVVRQSLALVFMGLAVGLALALLTTRLLGALLYGVSPGDPLTAAMAMVVMLAVGALAAVMPAVRAARVNPVIALRAN